MSPVRGSTVGPQALYLHVPFCASRCRYCDFSTAATRHGDPLIKGYAGALGRLVREAGSIGLLSGVRTVYVGGGTPTMLGADALASLGRAVISACGSPVAEASFEANPESLGDEVLARAVDAGFTRVSIGVQSFDDRELKALGRIHDAALARDRVAAAVASGLDASVDLMCGIPYQTTASWERSLAAAIGLGARHVSCYPLMIEEGTAMERLCEEGRLPWPDDDDEADDMEAAERVLGGAGLSRYEVASYAAPGRACRHNIAYWTGAEYVGLGASAAGMLGRGSYEVLRSAVPSLPVPEEGAERFRLRVISSSAEVAGAGRLADLAFEVEQLSGREAACEDLMLGMRMSRGVSAGLLDRARGAVSGARVDAAVERAVDEGLAVWREGDPVDVVGPATASGDGRRLVPTERGWLMGNELYGLFWDLAGD